MDTPYDFNEINQTEKNAREKIISTLIFILPLALVYVIGISLGGLENAINGADVIFRMIWAFFSSLLGTLISAIFFWLVIIALIFWIIYLVFEKKQKIDFKKIILKYFESIGWGLAMAIFLYIGLNWQLPNFFTFETSDSVAQQAVAGGLTGVWSKIVASIGAGVFEELLFRVLILNGIFMFFIGSKKNTSMEDDMPNFIKAAAISSLIFEVMHIGTVTSIPGLLFIFLGSLILSFIYLKRGYAVVAGTHIVFNLILLFGIIS